MSNIYSKFILSCLLSFSPSLGMGEAKKLTKAEEKQIEELNNQIKKIEKQLTPLDKKIDSLNKQLESLSKQTEPMYKQIWKLRNQIGKIKGTVVYKDCFYKGKYYPTRTTLGPFVCDRNGQWIRR